MFCSACRQHHTRSMFGSQQRRKSAKQRICKNPLYKKDSKIYGKEHGPWLMRMTYAEYADYIEFGHARWYAQHWAAEIFDREQEDEDQDYNWYTDSDYRDCYE